MTLKIAIPCQTTNGMRYTPSCNSEFVRNTSMSTTLRSFFSTPFNNFKAQFGIFTISNTCDIVISSFSTPVCIVFSNGSNPQVLGINTNGIIAGMTCTLARFEKSAKFHFQNKSMNLIRLAVNCGSAIKNFIYSTGSGSRSFHASIGVRLNWNDFFNVKLLSGSSVMSITSHENDSIISEGASC